MTDELRASDRMQSIFFSPKISYHSERLLPYLDDYRSKVACPQSISGIVPITMEIDLTNLCSHRCPLCVGGRAANSSEEQAFPVSGSGEQIPTARAAQYIRQMAEVGVKGIIFTGGGEPTLHPDLTLLVRLAHELHTAVGLITHGGLLHKHDMRALVQACKWIRVSIDAADAEEFETVHGRDEAEWIRIWSNVTNLVSVRSSLRKASQSQTATIGVAYLTGPHNPHRIYDFAKKARDHGVDYAQIRPFHRYIDYDATPYILQAKQLLNDDSFQVVGSLQKYSRISAGRIEPRTYSYCHISQFASVICANEKMYVCCHLRNIEDYCIGDLRTSTFADVIGGAQRANINTSVNVTHCQALCRGDQVNRQVQLLLDGATIPLPATDKPLHLDFL